MRQYVPHQYIGASCYVSTACVSICPAPIYWCIMLCEYSCAPICPTPIYWYIMLCEYSCASICPTPIYWHITLCEYSCASICPTPIYWESPLHSNRNLERLLLASVPHLGLPWPLSDGIPEFLVLQHTKGYTSCWA